MSSLGSGTAALFRGVLPATLVGVLIAGCSGDVSVTQSSRDIPAQDNPPPAAALAISGTPPTHAVAGSDYSFTPVVSNPGGGTLTFSIANKPAWATYSPQSGHLSGTPGATDVGTDSNIIISVSDGRTTVALPTFNITVTQQPISGSATLNWKPPTANTDGTALTDLAGYHVYYGTSASSLGELATVATPSATSTTLTKLGSGTWYFSLTSYTTAGVESVRTDPVSKTLP